MAHVFYFGYKNSQLFILTCNLFSLKICKKNRKCLSCSSNVLEYTKMSSMKINTKSCMCHQKKMFIKHINVVGALINTKRHNKELIMPILGLESQFIGIQILDLVITTLEVYFRKDFNTTQVVKQIINTQQRNLIFNCGLVQPSIVHTQL
jgi:hypothetical protein